MPGALSATPHTVWSPSVSCSVVRKPCCPGSCGYACATSGLSSRARTAIRASPLTVMPTVTGAGVSASTAQPVTSTAPGVVRRVVTAPNGTTGAGNSRGHSCLPNMPVTGRRCARWKARTAVSVLAR